MLHTHGITLEEVTINGRFNLGLFKKRVTDITPTGDKISPKSLARLAIALGAKGNSQEISKQIVFAFNSSDPRLKRRRGDGGYVYEKIAE